MHQSATKSSKMQKTSYFDKETKKKTDRLKNELYYKVFHACFVLDREGGNCDS